MKGRCRTRTSFHYPACGHSSCLQSLRRAKQRDSRGVTTKKKLSPGEERKRKHDTRVAALSISQVPKENQRSTRSLNQALLAGELHDAIILCLKDNKLMPLAALLRSLIDTSVLGIWFLKYAKDEAITESVAHLSTPDLVRTITKRTVRPIKRNPQTSRQA